MLGAIIGDIVGSPYQGNNMKSKDFPLFSSNCHFTDDTVMTLAVNKALLTFDGDYQKLRKTTIKEMQSLGTTYPNAGYGNMFFKWLKDRNPQPYNSFGNGSAMRVSGCSYVASSLDEAISLTECVTKISHNHPEGIKGANATTSVIYMALHGASKKDIREYICYNYYNLDFTLDEIRPSFTFNSSCQASVPPAIISFLEAESFESAIRNAVSLGGDSDTIAAITGSMAQSYYGIPSEIRETAVQYLDDNLKEILTNFEKKYFKK